MAVDESDWKRALSSFTDHDIRTVLEVRGRLPAESAIRTDLSADEFVVRYIHAYREGITAGAAVGKKRAKESTWIAIVAAVLAFFALHLHVAISIALGVAAAIFALRAVITTNTSQSSDFANHLNKGVHEGALKGLTNLAEDRRRIRELRQA